jgi:hypothetical protein
MHYIVPISVDGVRPQKLNVLNFERGWSKKILGRIFYNEFCNGQRLVAARSVKPAPSTSIYFSSPTLMVAFNRQTQTRETNEDNEKLTLEPFRREV